MIDESVVSNVLGTALRTGGDFAEVFAEDKRSSSAVLDDGKVEELTSGRDRGAGGETRKNVGHDGAEATLHAIPHHSSSYRLRNSETGNARRIAGKRHMHNYGVPARPRSVTHHRLEVGG